MKKLILSLVLAMVSLSVFAYDFFVDGMYFNITSKENLTVEVSHKDFHGNYSGDIIIPQKVTYNGQTYTVTAIGDDAFNNCDYLISLTIPVTITSKGNRVFYGCDRLEKIIIHCKNIEPWFRNRDSLKEVIIGEGTVTIGEKAFIGCHNLKSVTISNSVTSISNSAFEDCVSMTDLTIGNRVATIGDYAFHNCASLFKLDIPNSVKEIGRDAFSRCKKLAKVKMSENVSKIGNDAFRYCSIYSIRVPTALEERYCRGGFDSGTTVRKGFGDDEEFEYILKSGSKEQKLSLAKKYSNGNGVKKDLSKVFILYKSLADNGDVAYKIEIAKMYEKGEGIEKSLEKAAEAYFELAHVFGNAEGMNFFINNRQQVINNPKLAELMNKAYVPHGTDIQYNNNPSWKTVCLIGAAATGNLTAAVELADKLFAMKEIKPAIELYEKAAEDGSTDAMYKLGKIYLDSSSGGFMDIEKGIMWYTKAADSGHRDARLELGTFYKNGIHVKKDKKKAKMYLQ